MYTPSSALMQGLSELFWDFSWRFGKIPYKLPVRASNKEDKYNVHQKEQKVFLYERVFNPTSGTVALHVGKPCIKITFS